MYPNPAAQTPQWNQSQTPTSQPPQSQWSPQPPNGQYTPRQNQIPPISQALPQQPPAMQTLQPQHPDQYRALPAPPQMYAPPYQPQMQYAPPQPAPRQRTAIACRYCRRRKIRCSGFDQSEDGRCTNCQRFSQECVFTPVSAQTQAFVPAHTVWRGQNPPPNTQLYGAYGQPLPAGGRQEPYPPQQPQQPGQPGQYPQPPQAYAMYPNQPNMQQPGQPVQAGQKRPTEEPHTPTMPPPNPAEQSQQFPFGVANPADNKDAAIAADGAVPVTTEGAMEHQEEVKKPWSEMKDAGVQTDLAFPPQGKELDSVPS